MACCDRNKKNRKKILRQAVVRRICTFPRPLPPPGRTFQWEIHTHRPPPPLQRTFRNRLPTKNSRKLPKNGHTSSAGLPIRRRSSSSFFFLSFFLPHSSPAQQQWTRSGGFKRERREQPERERETTHTRDATPRKYTQTSRGQHRFQCLSQPD